MPITDRDNKSDAHIEVPASVFAALFENAAVGMARVDTDGTWLSVNERLCNMLGYSEPELTALRFQDLTYPEDLAADVSLLQDLVADRIQNYHMEKRYIRKDGSIFWAELHVGCCRDSNHAITEFVSVIVDIDARKKSEKAIAEAGERLRAILNGFVELVGLLSPEGHLLEANQRALDIGLLTRDDVIGKPFWETFWWSYDENVQTRLQDAIARARQGATVRYHERVRIADDDTIMIDFQLVPRFGVDGQVVEIVPSASDITDRYLASERQEMLMRELNHRIKNQLAMIQAMAHHTAKHASDLVSFNKIFAGRLQALAVSHDMTLSSIRDQPASLAELIETVVGPHVPEPDALLLLARHPDSLLSLDRDLAQSCGLILHELATNAVKYGAFSTAGGQVNISWHVEGATLALTWRETGVEGASKPATKAGFGHRLISMLSKNAQFQYHDGGLEVTLHIAMPGAAVH